VRMRQKRHMISGPEFRMGKVQQRWISRREVSTNKWKKCFDKRLRARFAIRILHGSLKKTRAFELGGHFDEFPKRLKLPPGRNAETDRVFEEISEGFHLTEFERGENGVWNPPLIDVFNSGVCHALH
jgi:hypothetical protein